MHVPSNRDQFMTSRFQHRSLHWLLLQFASNKSLYSYFHVRSHVQQETNNLLTKYFFAIGNCSFQEMFFFPFNFISSRFNAVQIVTKEEVKTFDWKTQSDAFQ